MHSPTSPPGDTRLPPPARAATAGVTPAEEVPWHALEVGEVLRHLHADPGGLAEGEAVGRLQRHGANRLTPPPRPSPLRRFLRQFANALIAILLAAAAVMLLLGDWLDAAVVAGVVLINAAIGFLQEGKAEKAMDAIRDMLSPQACVLRDGDRRTVAAEDLVPGD
ncbi:MAG: hypothetical protein RLY86_4490, partial [Pseudomonadota bacterium]